MDRSRGDRAGCDDRPRGRSGIAYPVCLDNDAKLWDAFHTDAWPSLYLLDKTGAIRWTHVGELHEGDVSWSTLQALLRTL